MRSSAGLLVAELGELSKEKALLVPVNSLLHAMVKARARQVEMPMAAYIREMLIEDLLEHAVGLGYLDGPKLVV